MQATVQTKFWAWSCRDSRSACIYAFFLLAEYKHARKEVCIHCACAAWLPSILMSFCIFSCSTCMQVRKLWSSWVPENPWNFHLLELPLMQRVMLNSFWRKQCLHGGSFFIPIGPYWVLKRMLHPISLSGQPLFANCVFRGLSRPLFSAFQ